jgi:hypothetical protein
VFEGGDICKAIILAIRYLKDNLENASFDVLFNITMLFNIVILRVAHVFGATRCNGGA